MDSRENFRLTLNHKEPERVVTDFGGHGCSMLHVSCVAALRKYYGLEEKPIKVADPFSMTGELDGDLLSAMSVDTQSVRPYYTFFGIKNGDVAGWKEWRMHGGTTVLVPENFEVTRDKNGGYYTYPQGDTSVPPSGHMPADGYYFDALIRQQPFEDDDELNFKDNLEEYSPVSEAMLSYYAEKAAKAAKSGRGVVASFGGTGLGDIAEIPGTGLKHPRGVRSIEEWYMSPYLRPDYVKQIFEKQVELAIENLKKIYAAVKDNVDAIFVCGTDFGTQNSRFLSEDTFREMYMPYYKLINGWVHENTQWKTIKHSCGAVEPLIPLFIESGFDCLNPVQCSASGMEPAKLKKKYGKDIVFWGGGVDTQRTLPFAKPDAVRDEVLRRCEIFAPGGGFVFNSVHCVQCGTPVENIVAMLDAVKEFNGNH